MINSSVQFSIKSINHHENLQSSQENNRNLITKLSGCWLVSLPAFLSFLFLNTDTMTSRFPITSTTMVVMRTPASRVTAQGKDWCC